tara:strand:- start:190 stop:381 length:192 start_codon:yes stop_codon:yes gene_type:complete
MKVKVHWVIDGIAEVEAESLEEAEKIVNERLSDFVGNNPDLEENMGAKAIQGKGYLPGSEEEA